ncbi:hypothetical protein [Mesorhizobium sp. Cs1299R1N1]|uniref:hypothetical protein n=1 Tax=Mesorhizobium sp. Cs1299R1N1 TaxID=3015172 RepID=UPI003FA6109B
MRESRRVQSRADARNWTLQRNLQNPALWTEDIPHPNLDRLPSAKLSANGGWQETRRAPVAGR